MTPAEIATMARLILDTHHALLHRELPRLAKALSSTPPPIRAPFFHLHQLLTEHLIKEENILFPMIFALASGGLPGGCGVAGPIRQMNVEHEQIRLLETTLRVAARDAGPEEYALLALLDDLSEHARKEDEELFPAVLALSGVEIEPIAPKQHRPIQPPPRKTGFLGRLKQRFSLG
jgi:iron-sulfur cluster repair protein YtfE (RIC family)